MKKKIKYIPKYDLGYLINHKSRKIKPNFSWYTLIATWFYIGLVFPMPGTIGSAATFPIYYLMVKNAYKPLDVCYMMWGCFAILFIIGWSAVKKFEQYNNVHDHKSIIIDEVLGMLLIFAICFPQCYELSTKLYKYIDIKPTYLCFIIAFVIFRYFDIRKPLFIKYIDKHMTNSLSVILDDLMAAVYTSIVIIIANYILNIVV